MLGLIKNDGFKRTPYVDNGLVELDQKIIDKVKSALELLESKNMNEKIETINSIKLLLHSYSPFVKEPVDCVIWVPINRIQANDYNPNNVAPPEMKLLEHSIKEDGYTQPIVTWSNNGHFEVVDGFHRNRIGRESLVINQRINGYLPITMINPSREERGDRITATIRHNRARGKHQVEKMADIVIELKRRNWTEERIGKELGMEPDEVLRLCQINGLIESFGNEEFSKAWDAGIFDEDEIEGEVIS